MAKIISEAEFMDGIVNAEREEERMKEIRRNNEAELLDKISRIEMSFLKGGATAVQLKDFCISAIKLRPYGICVTSPYLKFCKAYFQKRRIPICCKITENTSKEVKYYECKRALRTGAQELEYTPDQFAVANGNYKEIKREIRRVLRLARGRTVKINIKSDHVSRDKSYRTAQVAVAAGVKVLCLDAEEDFIREMRSAMGGRCFIQANGAQTCDDFIKMVNLNCARVSTSEGESIILQLIKNAEV